MLEDGSLVGAQHGWKPRRCNGRGGGWRGSLRRCTPRGMKSTVIRIAGSLVVVLVVAAGIVASQPASSGHPSIHAPVGVVDETPALDESTTSTTGPQGPIDSVPVEHAPSVVPAEPQPAPVPAPAVDPAPAAPAVTPDTTPATQPCFMVPSPNPGVPPVQYCP